MLISSVTGASFRCVIIDISRGGAQLQLVARNLPPGMLSLLDPEGGHTHDLNVVWREGDRLGASFVASSDLPD